jgi:hypothetical protein
VLKIYLSIALQPFIGHRPLLSFLIFYTVDRTPWTGDQLDARYRRAQTQNKRTQTSMPQVGFEPTIQCLSARRHFMPHRHVKKFRKFKTYVLSPPKRPQSKCISGNIPVQMNLRREMTRTNRSARLFNPW